MGEIGIPRREFLYDIVFWEAQRIRLGYARRAKDLWSAVRWQTFNLMCAQVGGKELNKGGVYNPADLLPLPWDVKDTHQTEIITEEDEKRLQQEMANMQAYLDEQWKKEHSKE